MTRREQKKDLTQKQILSAATALFSEKEYDHTSIDDISAKANVAKGTFYYHFPSKEALVVALLIDSLSDTMQKALHALDKGEKPLEILERVLLERAAWTEEHPELTKVFYEQRIHQYLFRENDPVVLVTKSDTYIADTDATIVNRLNKENQKPRVTRFFELIRLLVQQAQKNKELRGDLDATEQTQIIIATFIHAQGSWLGGYSSTSLIDKVHRWFHANLDGLYA